MSDFHGVGPIEVIPMEKVLEKLDIDEGIRLSSDATAPSKEINQESNQAKPFTKKEEEYLDEALESILDNVLVALSEDIKSSSTSTTDEVSGTKEVNEGNTDSTSSSFPTELEGDKVSELKERTLSNEDPLVSSTDNFVERTQAGESTQPATLDPSQDAPAIQEDTNSFLRNDLKEDHTGLGVELKDLYESSIQTPFQGQGPQSIQQTLDATPNQDSETIVSQPLKISEFEANAIQSANTLIGVLIVCIILSWMFFKKPISHIFAPVTSSSEKLDHKMEGSREDIDEKKKK